MDIHFPTRELPNGIDLRTQFAVGDVCTFGKENTKWRVIEVEAARVNFERINSKPPSSPELP